MLAGAAVASALWNPLLDLVYPPRHCFLESCALGTWLVTVPFLVFPFVLGALLQRQRDAGLQTGLPWRTRVLGVLATAAAGTAGLFVYETFVDPPANPDDAGENLVLIVLGLTLGAAISLGMLWSGESLARRVARRRIGNDDNPKYE